MAARNWTEEQKAAQSARLRALKPWLKSTGPKTVSGKKIVSMNAYKHGARSKEQTQHLKDVRQYLRDQKKFLQAYLYFHRLKCQKLKLKYMLEARAIRETRQQNFLRPQRDVVVAFLPPPLRVRI
jgi:hypothetical protein